MTHSSPQPQPASGLQDEILSRAILNSVQTRIAVVDHEGVIRLVNDSWAKFAQESGDPDEEHTGVGVNYVEVTRRAAEHGDSSAARAVRGIERVLRGQADLYELRYPCHSPTEEQWYLMRVTPLRSGTVQGAVISHIDITTQHLAERARARRARREADARRQAREEAGIAAVAAGIAPPPPPAALENLAERYSDLLEKAMEQRAFRVQYDLKRESRLIAQMLGRQTAGPRDVIALHTQTLEDIKRRAETPQKLQAYLEESRLLLIEVMGYLAAYYRDMIIADLEQRGI